MLLVGSANQVSITNDTGLSLSATYARLFDNGLITFDVSGKVFLSSLIGNDDINCLKLSNEVRFDLHTLGNMRFFQLIITTFYL